MAKKYGKLLMVAAALGAVAGGVYYYLKDRDALTDDDFDDDDFDNFDEDSDENETDRTYVDLDLGKKEESAGSVEEAAKEVKESTEEAVKEVKESAEEAAEEGKEAFKEGIQAAKTEAAEKIAGGVKKVEEFFDDEDSDGSMDAM